MVIFVVVCCLFISEGINKTLQEHLYKQVQANKQLLGLYQNEQSRTDTLYKIILHIREELSLLKLKNCPEEEFKNIPFEIIEWIDMLEKVSNGEDNGIHK